MTTIEQMISPIIHSPRLVEIAETLQCMLDNERRMRGKFYADMTPEMKIEFIDGEVVMHSPARMIHLEVTGWIHSLLHTYASLHKLGKVVSEKCLVVFPRNDYEPDVVFFGPEKAQSIQADTMKFPVPDLVVEVLSESTEVRDRGVKFEDFEAHGVQEYWIVDAEAGTVEQYVREGDALLLRMKSGSGELSSIAIPGLVVPVRACFDAQENLSALRAMLSH